MNRMIQLLLVVCCFLPQVVMGQGTLRYTYSNTPDGHHVGLGTTTMPLLTVRMLQDNEGQDYYLWNGQYPIKIEDPHGRRVWEFMRGDDATQVIINSEGKPLLLSSRRTVLADHSKGGDVLRPMSDFPGLSSRVTTEPVGYARILLHNPENKYIDTVEPIYEFRHAADGSKYAHLFGSWVQVRSDNGYWVPNVSSLARVTVDDDGMHLLASAGGGASYEEVSLTPAHTIIGKEKDLIAGPVTFERYPKAVRNACDEEKTIHVQDDQGEISSVTAAVFRMSRGPRHRSAFHDPGAQRYFAIDKRTGVAYVLKGSHWHSPGGVPEEGALWQQANLVEQDELLSSARSDALMYVFTPWSKAGEPAPPAPDSRPKSSSALTDGTSSSSSQGGGAGPQSSLPGTGQLPPSERSDMLSYGAIGGGALSLVYALKNWYDGMRAADYLKYVRGQYSAEQVHQKQVMRRSYIKALISGVIGTAAVGTGIYTLQKE